MSSVVIVEGDRQSGKTETLLALSVEKASKGYKILYVTVNQAVASNTLERAIVMNGHTSTSKRTRGSEQLLFPSGGVVWFLSAASVKLDQYAANMVVLDDYDSYRHPDRVLELVNAGSPGSRYYRTRTTGEYS